MGRAHTAARRANRTAGLTPLFLQCTNFASFSQLYVHGVCVCVLYFNVLHAAFVVKFVPHVPMPNISFVYLLFILFLFVSSWLMFLHTHSVCGEFRRTDRFDRRVFGARLSRVRL